MASSCTSVSAGRHVDLQVELADLGGPGRIRDRRQRLGVAHGGHAADVDQVQLDLLAYHRGILVEPALAQHAGERVQRAPDLVPVLAAVLAGDLDRLDVTAHGGLVPFFADLYASEVGVG